MIFCEQEHEEALKTTQTEQRKTERHFLEKVNSLEERLKESEHHRLRGKAANLQEGTKFQILPQFSALD